MTLNFSDRREPGDCVRSQQLTNDNSRSQLRMRGADILIVSAHTLPTNLNEFSGLSCCAVNLMPRAAKTSAHGDLNGSTADI